MKSKLFLPVLFLISAFCYPNFAFAEWRLANGKVINTEDTKTYVAIPGQF